MTRPGAFLFIVPFLFSIWAFLLQEKLFTSTHHSLQPIAPAHFQQAVFGYLHQVVAELHFVRAGVFLGGVKAGTDPESYAPTLAHNFRQITLLHPAFIAPYYYSQSYLAHVSPPYAQSVNEILETGRKAYPQDIILPFYQGFNAFQYLNEPLLASQIFTDAAQLPNAPSWFSHFAAILTAQGGNLQAGVLALQAMFATETNEENRARYEEEINAFRQAMAIQQAADRFASSYGAPPASLEELVPDLLPEIPSFAPMFTLRWQPPVVSLQRPRPEKQSR